MKTMLVSAAVLLGLSTVSVGQDSPTAPEKTARRSLFRGNRNTPPPVTEAAAPTQATTPPKDPNVKKTIELPPEPIPLEDLGKPKIALPDGPIDPYLLRKEHGPFMICAHVFRGPDATRYALALVLELQNDYHLPAYIFHKKIQPGGSNIRNVQPTAPNYISNGEVPEPEKYRVFDEAAVLVGNAPTIDDAEKLLKQVKKIKPKCVDALPSIWGHRKGQGLFNAFLTANPLQPAQNLYPGPGRVPATGVVDEKPGQAFDPYVATAALTQARKPDPLIKRMNAGPHSMFNCAGPYTLPVAEFRGRSTANVNDSRFSNRKFLEKSPLAQAGADAEELASNLMKCKSMQGFQAYVFHDRDRSVVSIGSFTGPDDPNLQKLRNVILELINEATVKRFTLVPLAPSPNLMEVPKG